MKALGNRPIPNLDKIGNLIIYLVDEVKKVHHQSLYLTKLLKLMYIIDETSVQETGAPVTGLEYRVWSMGPVAYNVYADLSKNDSEQLSPYVEAKKKDSKKIEPVNDRESGALIQSTNRFSDSEFSDYEMELIDQIINEYGYLTSEQLITRLHEEGTLWHQIVVEKGLQKDFESKSLTTSSYTIDLSKLIVDDPIKLDIFKNAQDSLNL